MMKTRHSGLEGKQTVISGSGNVAQFAARKVLDLGGKVLTLSDSSGTLFFPQGMTEDDLLYIAELKNERRARLSEASQELDAEYLEGQRPWHIPAISLCHALPE